MKDPAFFPLLLTLLALSALFFVLLVARFFPQALPSAPDLVGIGGRWARL